MSAEAQQRFNEKYITSTELKREMNVTRAAILYARRRGDLPAPIVVDEGHLTMWERVEIAPFLERWKQIRAERNQ